MSKHCGGKHRAPDSRKKDSKRAPDDAAAVYLSRLGFKAALGRLAVRTEYLVSPGQTGCEWCRGATTGYCIDHWPSTRNVGALRPFSPPTGTAP